MKLYASAGSPYVRKCLIVAHERGLLDRIERIDTVPLTSEELIPVNPLRRIPALVLDDGSVLVDSPVIVEYLDCLPGACTLVPPKGDAPGGDARWRALARQALADGVCDAAVLWRQEFLLRAENERAPSWVAKQRAAITRTVDQFDRQAKSFGDTFDIGTIAIAVAIDYLLFRFADEGWLAARPDLAAWFGRFTDRDSFHATKPVG